MNKSLQEKIYGCIFGYAVGDALGLGTELMTREEARLRYPEPLRTYDRIIRDAHRSQWEPGEWSNDTEVMVRISDEICRCNGLDLTALAKRFVEWHHDNPFDMADCMRWVLSDPGYIDDPMGTTARVWAEMGQFDASNEALGRSVIAAMLNEDVERDTVSLVTMTHHGSRCICTALVIAKVAHDLLWHDRMPTYDELARICRENDESVLPYLEAAYNGTIDDLQLDDPDTYWYTRRTMAAALWALWHCASAEEALYAMVDAAGDADTNASLATALAGLRDGIDTIPPHLVDGLVKREELKALADRFVGFILRSR